MLPMVQNFPFFAIFLCMVSGILSPLWKSGRMAWRYSVGVAFACAGLFGCVFAYTAAGEGLSFVYQMGHFPAPWGNELKIGPLEALLCTAFSTVMGFSLMGGHRDLEADILPHKQNLFFVMSNLMLAALLALTCTNDLFTAYVFVEISTIAACSLVLVKDTQYTLIATMRYLIMSLLGSGLILISIILLYSITGHLLLPNLLEQVGMLVDTGKYTIPLTVVIGLMGLGLAIKSALFPFHLWLPLAHGSATTSSSAILSGLVVKGYIVLLIKVFYQIFTIETIRSLKITNVIFLFGILAMIVGSVSALREKHIKRMLAYSSAAQIGYIYMGLGLGTDAGVVAAIIHILAHSFTKSMLFCCAGRLAGVMGHHKNLKNLRGAARRDRAAGVAFTIGALSMIGIPLFAGFASKLLFASATLLNNHKMLFTLGVLGVSTVLNALYYLPAVIVIWSRPEKGEEPAPKRKPDWAFTVSAVLQAAAVFGLGMGFGPLSELIQTGLGLF